MAKKKPSAKKTKPPKVSQPNKSDLIRTHKAEHPDHSPKMIAEALTNQGYSVSAQFVSTVLSNAKRKGGTVGKRGPKSKNKAPKSSATELVIHAGVTARLEQLKAASVFLHACENDYELAKDTLELVTVWIDKTL